MKQYAVTIMNLTTKEETEIVINADADETNNNVVLSTEVKGNRISASHYNYFPAYQSLRDLGHFCSRLSGAPSLERQKFTNTKSLSPKCSLHSYEESTDRIYIAEKDNHTLEYREYTPIFFRRKLVHYYFTGQAI